MNKLFERQLNKFFPQEFRGDERFAMFIKAIDDSYAAFERDIELSERAFRLSEMEYEEINSQLKEEIAVKKASIDKLKHAVTQLGDEEWAREVDENDLPGIAAILGRQAQQLQDARTEQQRQQQFYEHILNTIPANIAVIDKNNRYLFVNPSAVRDAGVRKWMIGKTDIEYHQLRGKPLAAAKERLKHFERVVASGRQHTWEEKIVNRSGETEYHLRMMHPVYHDNGELDMMVVYGVNITDRKRIEEQIQRSELRYRSIFDNSQALICTHDLEGNILDVNNAACNTLGRTREELIGQPVSAILLGSDHTAFKEQYLDRIVKDGRAEGVMVSATSEGEKIYLLYQNFLVKAAGEEPYVIGFSQDITARIAAERALKISEEKYRRIIENMNLGLLQVTPDEDIVYANQSFCKMSGYNIDELTGRKSTELFDIDEYAIAKVQERRRSGESDAYELEVKTPKGEDKWWLISGAPVFDDEHKVTGSIGIHLDITSQKVIEAELIKAKADAEASAKAKELFLANMSHEIRTPMNGIIGISRLLSKTSLDKQQRYYLDIIQGAASNLMVVINDLLDFTKIDSGNIELEQIGFDLKEQVGRSLQILGYKAEEKGLAFTCDCDEGIAPVLIGDPFRLNQVFMNLLSNAIKFTERGSVSLLCKVKRSTDDSQVLQFVVADTGVGISKEFMSRLFEKFTQEDGSTSRKFGGTGLGMSISKELIELMGGCIDVQSTKDVGTTISFELTLKIGTAEDVPVEQTLLQDPRILKGKRILLAEDNITNRILVTNILCQYGADVTEAEDGKVAIEKIQQADYDLVLMDMHMPEMNGLDATRYIRTRMNKDLPILALTASAFKNEEESCLAAGMNDFITKPIDEELMIQRIAHWLGYDYRPVVVASVPAATEPEEELFNMSTILSFANGDNSFVKYISQTFIAELQIGVENITVAYKGGNWEAMSAAAHKLRPAALNFKVNKMVGLLTTLEYFNGGTTGIDEIGKCIETINDITKRLSVALAEHVGI
jgi:PAS domain S-box-containing protein